MDALDALTHRVSSARLTEPAPSLEQRRQLFAAALRAPDHAQLRPWRFLAIEGSARNQLGELFAEAMQRNTPQITPEKLDKARRMPLRAPLLIVVIAHYHEHPKVPRSDQLLAAGCAAHAILLAAYAQGFGAIWRTGEMAHDAHVDAGLGLADNEEIVGYLYLGTAERELQTPEPLDIANFIRQWP